MAHEPILKQFGELTPVDFEEYPAWVSVHTLDNDEPWYDETDEETFRPWVGSLPVSPEDGMFLVRAQLTLADGRTLDGFVTPQHDSESKNLGIMQPHAFLPSGRLCGFWDGMLQRNQEERETFYKELNSDPSSTFPITFEAETRLADGHASGAIPGFCWRPKNEVEVYF